MLNFDSKSGLEFRNSVPGFLLQDTIINSSDNMIILKFPPIFCDLKISIMNIYYETDVN